MSRTTKVIAQRSMRYGTRMLKAGDEFDAKARDARLLIAIGRAKPVAATGSYVTKIEPPTPSVKAELQAKLGVVKEDPETPGKTAGNEGLEGSGDQPTPETPEAPPAPAPAPNAEPLSPEAQKAELRRRYREKIGEAPDYRWPISRLLRELGEA